MDLEKMGWQPQILILSTVFTSALNHAVCSDTVQPTSDRQGNMLCVWDVKPLASRPRSQHDHNTRSREELCRFGRCCLVMVKLARLATARVEACKVEENVWRE